jgi:hypothetical protein
MVSERQARMGSINPAIVPGSARDWRICRACRLVLLHSILLVFSSAPQLYADRLPGSGNSGRSELAARERRHVGSSCHTLV